MSDSSVPKVILVLGMHRSGSSALTRVINLLGAELPAPVISAEKGVNDEGFWEDQELVNINESIFSEAGISWYDDSGCSLVEHHCISADLESRLDAHIEKYYLGQGPYVIKDPRLSLTSQYWESALEKHNVDVCYACVVRPPEQVAKSLRKRDSLPLELGLALWVEYSFEIISAVKDSLHVVVSYENLLTAPREIASEIYKNLFTAGSPVSSEAQKEITSFISPSLSHHGGDFKYDGEMGDLWKYANDFYLRLRQLHSFSELGQEELETMAERWRELRVASSNELSIVNRLGALMNELASEAVENGKAYSEAVEVISAKDQDIADQDALYQGALETVARKDENIAHLDNLYQEALGVVKEKDEDIEHLGKSLAYAEKVVGERDAQLQEQLREKNAEIEQINEMLMNINQRFLVRVDRALRKAFGKMTGSKES